jgi:toxin YhaV
MKLGAQDGWQLFGDRHFEVAYQDLREGAMKVLLEKNFKTSNQAKRLKALSRIFREVVPSNPAGKEFQLGNTLGSTNRSWRRAKFLQQYRLFFRFDSKSKIIIYSWFNDEESLRAYGSKTDAYLIFEKMLNQGDPPSNWESLLGSAE